ncbi:phage regulatory CII family protein, partial [Proteus terrae]|uniref:phage regulatory CII family protein n=2 Tax=Proteus terrae TaxID=1574161 RepID=UPI00207D4D39|nr:phage regulatory CII family protein [Proteus terrae]
SLWDALRMNMMISYQELVRTFPNVPAYLLTAVGEVGKLATNTVSGGNLNNARVADFKRSVNTAIRCLTLAGITLSARLHTNPAFACAVDAVANLSPSMM